MLIAQISDMHIRAPGQLAYGRIDNAWHLARCVEQVRALAPAPDLVLTTGDLVDAGQVEEYRHLRELLAPLGMPVYLIPGNHDDRDALRRASGDDGYLPRDGFVQYVLDAYRSGSSGATRSSQGRSADACARSGWPGSMRVSGRRPRGRP